MKFYSSKHEWGQPLRLKGGNTKDHLGGKKRRERL